MLETKRLELKLINSQDELDIVKWRNEKEIINNLFGHKGVTLDEHRAWFDGYLKDKSRIEFIIYIKGNNKKIGTIGLSSIDYRNQKAEYGILIGEIDERKKGYAKEASIAIIKYGFEELNLNKIYLRVFFENKNAIKLYEKVGFQKEGILKKEIYKNGMFKDLLFMSILRSEWVFQND